MLANFNNNSNKKEEEGGRERYTRSLNLNPLDTYRTFSSLKKKKERIQDMATGVYIC